MPREDARTHLTRQWLTKASRDMRAALLALSAQDELWDIAAFHSQQVAEKALKAFLAWHNMPSARRTIWSNCSSSARRSMRPSLPSVRPQSS